jgi:glycosyltransferase involved in cell wall biosynthesis
MLREDTTTNRPILTVWNCPMRGEIRQPKQIANRRQGLTLFYHGSIVPSRLPLDVIRAMGQLSEKIILRIAGYETIGHQGYVTKLRCTAAEYGLENRLEFLGAIPQRADLLTRCREANVGLALMPLQSKDWNEMTMLGASNKPFDYMSCGLALLVSDLPDWTELYVANGFGRSCDPNDSRSIADALRWFLAHAPETAAMGEEGRKKILAEWNYEKQFAAVADRLIQAKHGRDAPAPM